MIRFFFFHFIFVCTEIFISTRTHAQFEMTDELLQMTDSVVFQTSFDYLADTVESKSKDIFCFRKGLELYHFSVYEYASGPDSSVIRNYYDDRGKKIRTVETVKNKIGCPPPPVSQYNNYFFYETTPQFVYEVPAEKRRVKRRKEKTQAAVVLDSSCFVNYVRITSFYDSVEVSYSVSDYLDDRSISHDTIWYDAEQRMRKSVRYLNGNLGLCSIYEYKFDDKGRITETKIVDTGRERNQTRWEGKIYRGEEVIPLYFKSFDHNDTTHVNHAQYIYNKQLQQTGFKSMINDSLVSFSEVDFNDDGKQTGYRNYRSDSTLTYREDYVWKIRKNSAEFWQKNTNYPPGYTRTDTTCFFGRKTVRISGASWSGKTEDCKTLRRSKCKLGQLIRYDHKGRMLKVINYGFEKGKLSAVQKMKFRNRISRRLRNLI
jgi:hypothetical protein